MPKLHFSCKICQAAKRKSKNKEIRKSTESRNSRAKVEEEEEENRKARQGQKNRSSRARTKDPGQKGRSSRAGADKQKHKSRKARTEKPEAARDLKNKGPRASSNKQEATWQNRTTFFSRFSILCNRTAPTN